MANSTTMRHVLAALRELAVSEVDAAGVRHRLYTGDDAGLDFHLEFDARRLAAFLSLVPIQQPPLRVLELGANPYILTYALARRGVDVVAAGHPLPTGSGGTERVEFERSGDGQVVLRVPLVRFNLESEVFPFDDGAFDVVICGEIIEHLPYGPFHMLTECNRVLKPGGRFLLSTPNSVSVSRLLTIAHALMGRNYNTEWPFSPQGIYARHNRLYTLFELHDLLVGNGFRPFFDRGFTLVHQRHFYRRSLRGLAGYLVMRSLQRLLNSNRGPTPRMAEGLLIASEKVGEPRLYRPPWLYGAADTVPMIAGDRGH